MLFRLTSSRLKMTVNRAPTAGEPTRYGRRSILYAVCAFVLVMGMFIAYGLTTEAGPKAWQDMTGTAGALAFLIVAPLLHVVGIVMGLRGLFGGRDSTVLSGVGVLLNISLLSLGFYLVWLMLPGLTAFR